MTTPTRRRNPYRHFLRNVHVRRIYMLTALPPVWLVLFIPLIASKDRVNTAKNVISEIMLAFKDGNSYD